MNQNINEAMTLLKNDTKLEIKNVICFYVGSSKPEQVDKVKETKEEDWSYQDYLTMCCAKRKINLFWLNKSTVRYSYQNNIISIDDDTTDVHFSLKHSNVHDTIIFQGQANDSNKKNYEGLMRAFEYENFFMLNTLDEINLASDKYLASNLIAQENIPQPGYVLITRELMQDLNTECHDTRESFWKMLDSIYKENENINTVKDDRQYVCKILNGSLGIGVFICNHSEIEGILQAMFAVDEEAEFLIQEYKENTGDIRVHAFSVDGAKYEILACMKRDKIKGDFRSNVSLGATTEEYEMTDKQKEIALKVAKLSGCRWVGIDLMACTDGDYVIEYNSSPGVQGISQQIKKNMFDIVIDKIEDYMKKHAVYHTDDFEFGQDKGNCFSEYNKDTLRSLYETSWVNISNKRQNIMFECLQFQPGLFYKIHGKDKPEYGLDCSGYVHYVIKKSLNMKTPYMCVNFFTIFSDSDWEQIKEEDLKPGDIGVKNESNILNHCGIYAGEDKWFDTSYLYGAQLSDYSHFKFFFRMKNVDTDPIDEHNRKLENYLSEIGVLPEVTNNLPEPTTIEITPSLNIGEEPIISVIDDII
jgi:RimK family alpha-L-glutamate ligase